MADAGNYLSSSVHIQPFNGELILVVANYTKAPDKDTFRNIQMWKMNIVFMLARSRIRLFQFEDLNASSDQFLIREHVIILIMNLRG